MKRTFFSFAVTLMALTLFFTGCADPVSDYTVVDVAEELPGPEKVTVTPYPGANVITWTYVRDAKSYTIYRQRYITVDTVDTVDYGYANTFVATVENDKAAYVDAVSFENQLKNGEKYLYSVMANTELGLNGRAAYVKNGETFATDAEWNQYIVTTVVPPQGTVVTDAAFGAPAITVTAEKVTTDFDQEELLVSWPAAHPAFSYQVRYDLPDINYTIVAGYASGGDIWHYSTPLFGGNSRVRLLVTFAGDQYYYKQGTVTKDLSGLTLTEPLSFNLTNSSVVADRGEKDSTTATISWLPHTSAPKKEDYKLYRIELKGDKTNANYNNVQKEVAGAWTAVTVIDYKYNYKATPPVTLIVADDTGLDPAKGYLYALYAEVDGRKSAPFLVALGAEKVVPPELPELLKIDINTLKGTFIPSRGIDTTTAAIEWLPDEAVPKAENYRLLRTEVEDAREYEEEELEAIDEQAWTLVSDFIYTTKNSATYVVARDTGLNPDKTYVYVLYAEVGGRQSEKLVKYLYPEGAIITAPLNFTPSFNAGPARYPNDPTTARIEWSLNAPLKAENYRLLRAELEVARNYSPAELEAQAWTSVSGFTYLNPSTVVADDTGLEAAKRYVYVLYAELGERQSEKSLPGYLNPVGVTIPGTPPAFDATATYTQAANGTRTYSATVGWIAQADATYTLAKASLEAGIAGTFTALDVPDPVAGRYTVIDTPAIRQSYVYRLTVTQDGITATYTAELISEPFSTSIGLSGFSASPDPDYAYAIRLNLAPGGYDKDLSVDIYRAEAPQSVTSAGFNNSVEKEAFKLIAQNWPLLETPGQEDNSGTTYTDKGPVWKSNNDTTALLIGTRYVYRVVYKVGSTVLSDDSYFGSNAGYVQTPSRPNVSVNASLYDVTNASARRFYYTVSQSGSYGIIGATVQVQSRTRNTTTSPWSEWANTNISSGPIAEHNSNAGDDLKWGTVDTGVPNNSFYFYIAVPSTAMTANTQYRLMLVNGNGNVVDSNYGNLNTSLSW